MGRHNPDIPGRSNSVPSGCHFHIDEENKKCGKPAVGRFEGTLTIYDKQIRVKKPVCQEHLEELQRRKDASDSTD